MKEHRKSIQCLFRKMSEHTQPICESICKLPQTCCSPEYCSMAIEEAEEWGIDIKPLQTNHPMLMFMGPKGCVVEPYLRPSCTLHVCCINGIGFRAGHPKWTEEYFKLRNEINKLTIDRMESKLAPKVEIEL